MYGMTKGHHTLASHPSTMFTKLYSVALTFDQRKELARLVKTGAPKAFTSQRV